MFVETLTEYVLAVNDWLYQPWMVPLVLLVVGAWLTVRSGFVQFRRFRLWRCAGLVFDRLNSCGHPTLPRHSVNRLNDPNVSRSASSRYMHRTQRPHHSGQRIHPLEA